MNYPQNVYIFDSSSALISAKNSLSKNQLFFYDGEKLDNEPSNCINVPIDNFIEYFMTSAHPYPQEINFDNMGFSDSTQQQIIQNLTNALSTVQNEKTKELNIVLENEINPKNLDSSLNTMLEYIYVNDLINETFPFTLIYKLLEATNFILSNDTKIQENNKILIDKLIETINLYHNKLAQQNLYIIHLKYALSLLSLDKSTQDTSKKEYFNSLASYSNLQQLIDDFILVKTIYPEEKLKEYLKYFGQSLFNDKFWDYDILRQKHTIFKLYYLTGMFYGRGDTYKEIFYTLNEIFKSAIKKQLDELVFYLYTPLMMSWSGSSQTQEELKYFNEHIEKPLENYILNHLVSKYNLKQTNKKINKKNKIKVAFLQERMINYSIFSVFYSLIKSIADNPSSQYEFTIYDLNFKEFGGSNTNTVEDLKKLGIKYVDLHKECVGNNDEFYSIVRKSLQVRRKLIKDKIDILIGMHSRPEYNFLYTTRTAPKQIYWSHGNFEYQLQNIDQYISHFQADAEYSFYKDFALAVELEKYNPPIDSELIKNTRDLYPKESFILGSIGRMIKIDDEEYIKSVAAIMKTNPNTIYLACGDGDIINIISLLKKYDIKNRFYFTGRIDAHLYGYIIDLWLTPFKIGGGEAFQEYIHKKKPFVSLVNGSDEWIQAHENRLRRFVYPYSHEKYIEYASKLIQTPDLAQEVTEVIAKEREAYTNENNTVEQFIKSISD